MGSKTDTKETSPQVEAFIRVFRAVIVLALGALIGYFVWHNATAPEAKFPFKLGLDLAGGFAFAREQGGRALRTLTYRARGALLGATRRLMKTRIPSRARLCPRVPQNSPLRQMSVIPWPTIRA